MFQDAANSFHHFGIFLQQHPSYFLNRSVVHVVDDDWEGGKKRAKGVKRGSDSV